jgi:iron complex transport system substrate-binding protein
MKKIINFFIVIFISVSCNYSRKLSTDRFVVLSPEIAEILCEIGAQDKIIAVSAECDYPAILKEKEIVGNFNSVSYEKIISLNPSIVFTTALTQDHIASELKKLNLRIEKFYPKKIDDLFAIIDTLGILSDCVEKADSLNVKIKNVFSELKKQKNDYKPKIYIEIYGEPIMSVANNSFVGSLLSFTGCENIFPVLPRDYSMVPIEDIILKNPDIIIITYPGVTSEIVKNRKGWQTINAVKNNKIYTIEDINPDIILRAGPRNIEGVLKINNIVREYIKNI